MKTNYTLFNNPIANGIFEIFDIFNKGVVMTALVLLLGWYSIQVHESLSIERTLNTEYGIDINNKRYVISNVCESVIVDYDTLSILGHKNKDNMADNCPEFDSEYIKKLVDEYNHNTNFLNGSDDYIIYGALFILVIVFSMTTMIQLILSSPFRGAIAITILWVMVSCLTFPLNFGAKNISYEIVEVNTPTVYVFTAISNDSNNLYVYSPLTYTDLLLNLSDDDKVNQF